MSTVTTMTSPVALATGQLPIPAEGKSALAAKPNMPNIPSETIIRQQAAKALASEKLSGEYKRSATQRMAYVIMCEHAAMSVAGKTKVALGTVYTSAEAKKEVKKAMVDFFTTPLPTGKGTNGRSDVRTALLDDNTALRQLIDRSLTIASILSAGFVTFESFNEKTGFFSVPVGLLHPKGVDPIGILARNKVLPLANQTIRWTITDKDGKEQFPEAKASTDQIKAIAKGPAKERQGSNAPDDTDKAGKPAIKMSVEAIATDIGDRKLVAALHRLWVEDADKPFTFDDMPATMRNQITQLMATVDKAHERWLAKAEARKTVAKANAKAHPARILNQTAAKA